MAVTVMTTPPRFDRAVPLAMTIEPSELTCLGQALADHQMARLHGADAIGHAELALRLAIRRLAQEARANDAVRAERLLVSLRRGLYALPSVRRLLDEEDNGGLWDLLVLLCCEEFYGCSLRNAARVGSVGTMTSGVDPRGATGHSAARLSTRTA
jgi:hypothetical protein